MHTLTFLADSTIVHGSVTGGRTDEQRQTDIGVGSIYNVGGPDAERRRCQRDGGRSERRVRNLYQLFIL